MSSRSSDQMTVAHITPKNQPSQRHAPRFIAESRL